jgi:hypothetical protein
MTATVRVAEVGRAPSMLTLQRERAPRAAKVLAEIFEENEFGSSFSTLVDWDNSTKQIPDGAPVKPILYIQAMRVFPDRRTFTSQSRIDIDDVFSRDLVSREFLVEFVNELRVAIKDAEEKWKDWHGNH